MAVLPPRRLPFVLIALALPLVHLHNISGDAGQELKTFEALGWREDVVLTEASPTARLRVVLPEDASQGNPLWYGVHLRYSWVGEPLPGGIAYLYVHWNGQTLYQLKIKRPVGFATGFEWSMVDLLQGGSFGREFTNRFAASSSNYAVLHSVTGGENELTFELDTRDAGDAKISVTISRYSEIVADYLPPPDLDISGWARVSPSAVNAEIVVENRGRPLPALRVRLIATSRLARSASKFVAVPALSGRGDTEQVTLDMPVDYRPIAVHAYVDYGAGRAIQQIWPTPAKSTHGLRLPPITIFGVVASIGVLWLTLPEAWTFVRRSRS